MVKFVFGLIIGLIITGVFAYFAILFLNELAKVA